MAAWVYCSRDVWKDTRRTWRVNLVKTLNLTVRSFFNSDLQSKSYALSFRTLLALVPALALLCAIGRGFGLQDNIEQQLVEQFPSQSVALEAAFKFVDSYLAQASGGVFVGVGVVFLLWTLISLLQSVESTFNEIWMLSKGRSIWRMSTDYLAIFLILPVLMICASGISIFMSTSAYKLLPFSFMKPAVEFVFDCVGVMLSWLFFAGTYMLIPNTKVKFRNAIIAGILVGTACQALQWAFLSGQVYVSQYNAIYGSFSFLPLMMIWMQLVWLFTLIGAVLCYSLEHIGEYNFGENIKSMSHNYRLQTSMAVMTVIAKRFALNKPALSAEQIAQRYRLPINLVVPTVRNLCEVGLVSKVEAGGKDASVRLLQPAINVVDLTAGEVVERLNAHGDAGFLPYFETTFASVKALCEELADPGNIPASQTKIIELNVKV